MIHRSLLGLLFALPLAAQDPAPGLVTTGQAVRLSVRVIYPGTDTVYVEAGVNDPPGLALQSRVLMAGRQAVFFFSLPQGGAGWTCVRRLAAPAPGSCRPWSLRWAPVADTVLPSPPPTDTLTPAAITPTGPAWGDSVGGTDHSIRYQFEWSLASTVDSQRGMADTRMIPLTADARRVDVDYVTQPGTSKIYQWCLTTWRGAMTATACRTRERWQPWRDITGLGAQGLQVVAVLRGPPQTQAAWDACKAALGSGVGWLNPVGPLTTCLGALDTAGLLLCWYAIDSVKVLSYAPATQGTRCDPLYRLPSR